MNVKQERKSQIASQTAKIAVKISNINEKTTGNGINTAVKQLKFNKAFKLLNAY